MISEQRLESLEYAIKEAKQHPAAKRIGSHWWNCWTEHPACAVVVVEELVAELRAAAARQVTLDRTIVTFLAKHARTMSTKEFDDQQKEELARIATTWKVPLR